MGGMAISPQIRIDCHSAAVSKSRGSSAGGRPDFGFLLRDIHLDTARPAGFPRGFGLPVNEPQQLLRVRGFN